MGIDPLNLLASTEFEAQATSGSHLQAFVSTQAVNDAVFATLMVQRNGTGLATRQQRERNNRLNRDVDDAARKSALIDLIAASASDDVSDDNFMETIDDVLLTDSDYAAYAQSLMRLSPEEKFRGYLKLLKSIPNLGNSSHNGVPDNFAHSVVLGVVVGGMRLKNGDRKELPPEARRELCSQMLGILSNLVPSLQASAWYSCRQEIEMLKQELDELYLEGLIAELNAAKSEYCIKVIEEISRDRVTSATMAVGRQIRTIAEAPKNNLGRETLKNWAIALKG